VRQFFDLLHLLISALAHGHRPKGLQIAFPVQKENPMNQVLSPKLNLNVSRVCLLGVVSLASVGFASSKKSIPQIQPFAVEQIYIPFGFDDNDNSEVIIHGSLPNTCYKFKEFQPTVDAEAKSVSINAFVYQYPNINCLQMMIPFTGFVKLGVLKKGDYKVQVTTTPQLSSQNLNITSAKTESADEFLYAPVDSVSLTAPKEEAGQYDLNLQGRFPNMLIGCMVMKEVKAQLQGNNLLVVQPIAEIADDERCAQLAPDLSYKISTKVSGDMPADVLVHVRSLNGQSVNRHYDSVPQE
jgi:hypothetical protein